MKLIQVLLFFCCMKTFGWLAVGRFLTSVFAVDIGGARTGTFPVISERFGCARGGDPSVGRLRGMANRGLEGI